MDSVLGKLEGFRGGVEGGFKTRNSGRDEVR